MHANRGVGRLIAGRYRLQDPIGRGSMGIVWRGRDELLHRDVAVKEVHLPAAPMHEGPAQADPAAEIAAVYRRVLREARTAAQLTHPGAVTVYDVVEEDGCPWIIMELVRARSLDRVIIEDGPLPPLQAAELGASLVSALAAAHAAGVLHRDVKPSNVLVTSGGRVVLTDFGIATFAEDPAMTQAGIVVGTAGFTAPERVRGDVATPAADLWSLGATLYAAVEGRGPFERAGGSTAITAGVAVEDAPRAPSAGPLGPVIDALLRRDPASRPDAAATARLLADAAAAARTGTAAASRLGTGDASPGQSHQSAAAAAEYAASGATLVPVPANDPSPDRGADAHSPAADADAARRAAFLDPPVYAELSMPDLSGPREPLPTSFGPPPPQVPSGQFADLVAGAAGSVAAGSVAAGSVAAGGAPHRRNGRLRPSSGRWRLMVAGAGVAAIAVAAIIGWSVYDDRTPIPLALQTPSSPATAGNTSPAMTGHLKSDHSTRPAGLTSPSAGHPSPTSSPQGHARPTSTPKGTPSGRPGPHRSASPNPSPSTAPSRSISPSASPSPSPSPTPSSSSTTQPSQPALPPGWVWHTFTASQLGAIAGFEIGLPPAWTQNVTGQVAHLNLPVSKFHVTVGLAPWAYPVPLSQADYLDDIDSATYPRFRTLLLRGIGFAAAGGYEPAKAAELKFSWVKPAAGKLIRYVLLVTLDTSSGAQPYTLAVSAPAATFGPASGVFHTALGTFRPLPASP